MSPEGMPRALRASTHSAVGRCFSFASRSGVRALRFFFRSSRSWKRGSVLSSSTPTISVSASHCSCLLAAMLMWPSWVAKVPEGAAVKLSLPMGTGLLPPIRRLAATQPIIGMIESRSATSISWPSPVFSRW